MKNFVLKGHICYSLDKNHLQITENGYLICKNGKSAGVFSTLPDEYKSYSFTDYGDKLIIPGLVDLHIHAPQYAFRGTGMDLELMDWLQTITFPEEAKYSDLEYAKKAYSIFANDMKMSATTRASIFATKHVPATELLMELMDKTGLYSYVGKINMDRGAPEELLDSSADISAFLTFCIINYTTNRFQRTKPILTPRFIPCCSDSLLAELHQVQMTYHIPVQSHLSENPDEVAFVHQLSPDLHFYGEGYDNFGMFGESNDDSYHVPTIMAHCIYSTEDEVARIKEHNVYVAHCPASNINLSSGIAPIRKYLNLDINVGLGSDIAGGHSNSIFHAMVDAIGASKMYWRYVDNHMNPLSFDEVFFLATKGGGSFFGKVGSFEPSYEFDAVILNDTHLSHPQQLSIHQRLERFAYLGGDASGLFAKYAGGEQIF